MAILDSKGRLFGKLSLLDVGAALVMVLVVIGIFFFPGTSGSIAQVSDTQPIEIDVLVRGLSLRDPNTLLNDFNTRKKTDVIVRNQPSGSLDIMAVKVLERQVLVSQPDGTLKAVPEPRMVEGMSTNFLITLAGKAQVTDSGPVIDQSQIKLGKVLELDGSIYNFKGSIVDVRLGAN